MSSWTVTVRMSTLTTRLDQRDQPVEARPLGDPQPAQPKQHPPLIFLVDPEGRGFYPALVLGCLLTMALYGLMIWVGPKLGLKL